MISVRPYPPTPLDVAKEQIWDRAHDEVIDVDIAYLCQLVNFLRDSSDAETQDSRLPWATNADQFVDSVLDANPYAPPQVARVLWSEINDLVDEAIPGVEATAHLLLESFSNSERNG